ncbi:MAG: PIG-L family deacetylase [Thaumarchaeota archaeon]|nr:PIG-L family deacetylase [Nitrososphaerota archaeon]
MPGRQTAARQPTQSVEDGRRAVCQTPPNNEQGAPTSQRDRSAPTTGVMAADWLVGLGIAVIVLPLLYIYTVSVVQTRFPTLRNKRICLLVAHPDDEAMFFAPTVLALTRPETGNHVKILCLSSGALPPSSISRFRAEDSGTTRRKEGDSVGGDVRGRRR